ncbi:hypothetical protein KL86DES1_21861 [uncultured Desulfovibrio sp.]|uniref:Uncharacterized protein n=1 Tax=uncultured Desulfovibrio sp. TaxID=167968 RepID=A0A212LAF4_9BACT|nr:hypothetical protein KL86DES1_21861 [uncultured Desulfovibrio sp.]VZH34757.1 conserved protein of unknown function [Desulfovibrio sp. 86]
MRLIWFNIASITFSARSNARPGPEHRPTQAEKYYLRIAAVKWTDSTFTGTPFFHI